MNRALTLFLFVICAVGVAAAAGQRQGSGNVGNDVAIKSFTLTASDGVNGDEFGGSVEMDGDTVVVGADLAVNKKGAVYVFVKPPSGWANMTQVAKLTASDGQVGDRLGLSVSISGNTIVAGAPDATINGNRGQGAAYVFVEPAGGWSNMTETAKLTASDAPLNISFGQSASMQSNTVVIGASYPTGAAYVFVKPQNGWKNMTETAELRSSDGTDGDSFGISASISGNTIAVGAWEADGQRGEAYVFVEPPNGWTNTTETAKLTASDGAINDALGVSVSVSSDTVAVGALGHFSESGAAYMYVKPPNGWGSMTETAEIKNTKQEVCLGSAVSLDGQVLVAITWVSNSDSINVDHAAVLKSGRFYSFGYKLIP